MERTPRCPASDRYSLLHDGNSHVLDHLLVSPSHAFDVIHTSTEFTLSGA